MTTLATIPKYGLDYKESVWDNVPRIGPRINSTCLRGRKTPSRCALFMPGMGFHCIDTAMRTGLINTDTTIVLVEKDTEKLAGMERHCSVRGFKKWAIIEGRVEEVELPDVMFDYIYLDTDNSIGENYCKLLSSLHFKVWPKSDIVVSCVLDKTLKFQQEAFNVLSREYKGFKSPYLTFYRELMVNMTKCGAKRLVRKQPEFPMWEVSNLLIWSALTNKMRIKLLFSEEFRDGKIYLTNRYRIKSIGRSKSETSYLVKAVMYDLEKKRRQAKNRRNKARDASRNGR